MISSCGKKQHKPTVETQMKTNPKLDDIDIHVEPMPPQWQAVDTKEPGDKFFTREEWDVIFRSMLKGAVIAVIVGVASALIVVELFLHLLGVI
jgi:hypothetical protein